MSTQSSSYALEMAHQRRMVLLVAVLLLLFGVGVRFDRAFITQALGAKGPAAAFSALVPPPTVFPGAVASSRGSAVRGGVLAPGESGAPPVGAVAPSGTAPGITAPGEQPIGAPAGPGPTAPAQIAPGAPGQFGSTGSSLFGVPSGVIFGAGGGGGGGTNPGTPPLVPEPESWAFMILGIGMIGAMLRARRASGERARGIDDTSGKTATA